MKNGKPSVGIVEFKGSEREYEVLSHTYWTKQGINPPKYWVMYDATEEKVLISDEVKEDYRKYMVFHELYEFEHNPDGAVRCLDALKEELDKLPEGEIEYYVPFRRDTFEELVAYWGRQNVGEPRDGILEEARESLSYLEELGREDKK
jgi:hypothetical protein